MNEQLLKDFLATAKKDNYNWDVILPKFPELKDYDLQLLKDYAATAKKDNYDYSIINPKFPEFNLEEQEGGEPVNFTEGSVEQQEQPTEPLEKPIVDKVNLNPYTVTTTSLAGRNIEPKTDSEDSFRGKFKQLLDEEVEKIDDDKIVSQEEQSDILSKLTKRAEQIEVERAGIEVPEDALFEKTSQQKALDELLVKEFPIDVISEGGRNVSPTIENLEKLKKLDPAFSDYVYNKALKQKNFFDKLEKGQVTERDKYKIMADFNSLKLQDSYDNLQITINENNKIVEDIDKSIEQQKNEMLSTPYFVLDEDGKFSAGIIKTPEQRAEAQSMYNKLNSLIDGKNAQLTSPQYSKNYIDFLNASAKQDALESGEYKDIHKKLKENEIYKEELLDGSWASFGKDLTARLVNGASSFVANSVAFPASMASSYRSLIGADYKYGISDMVVDWAESTSEPFNASERKFTMKDPFTGETKYDAGGLVLSGVDQLGLLFGLAFGNKYSSIKAANKLSKAGITGKRASDAMKISQRWNTFLTGTMASHAQNLRESREMGLSGADLFAYTTFMSTLEGTSELVFPNQNILGKDLKDIALKTFVKNLGKGRKLALKASLNEVLTAMGSEAAEEYIVLLGKMTQTALISINNEEINTYIPEFEEVIETGAVASLVGGGSTSVIQGYQNITGAKRKEVMSYAISKGTEVDFNGLKTAVAQQVEKENISQYDADSYLLNVHLANNYAKYIPDEIKGKTRQELLPIAQELDSLIKQSKEKEGVAKKALQERIKVLEGYMESKIKGEAMTQTPSYDKPTVFTTPTSERYGTVNRQDGKGDVVLTEEEYNAEMEIFTPVEEVAPTEEVSETVETISPLSERLKNVRVARVGGTFDKGARGEAINEKEIEEAQSVLMDELNEIEKSNLPQEQKDAASAEVEKLFNELENYELTTETKTRKITQKRPTRVVREGVKEQTKSPQERSVGRKINIVEGTEFTQEGFVPQEGETIVLEEQDGKIVLQAFDKDGNKTKSQELELESVNDLELVETLKDDDGRVIGATVRNKNNDAEVFSIMDEELALDYAIEKTKAEVGEMSIEEESVFEEYEEVKKRPTKKELTKEVVEDDSDKIFEQKKSEIESRRQAELEANSRFTGEKVIVDQINAKYDAELSRLEAQESQKEESKKAEEKTTDTTTDTQETTEGAETTTELTEEQVSELNKFLDIDKSKRKASRKGITKKDNQRLDKVERAVDLLEQSLSEVMPNIVISVAEDSDMFARFAGEQEEKKEDRSKGLFTRVDGTYVIVLNPDSADVTTVFHEGLHAVLVAGGLPNTMARAVTSRMVEAVKKTATKKLQRELEAFTELYETPLQSEEYIAELIGILANNYNEQNNETKSIIRRWLQKLAEMLGLKPKGVSLSTVGLNNTDAATIDALNFVAKKMSEGGVLTEQDLTRLVQPGEEQQGDGSEETVTRKQRRKKPKSKVKDAFEWGMQKGIPAIAVKNHLIKLGYTEEEITSGAYDAEKIWNKDGKKVVKWLDYGRRAALSARKFRPQTMFLAKEAMESSISAELRQAKMMAENLNRAINKYKSQDKRDELIDAVDEFMRDAEERDFWRNELPDDIAQIAEAMRVHIDSLSLKLVDSGVIKAESSRENILGNIGVYMNRSYQVFDNKNWKEEVSDQVITAAQNHLREAYYNSLNGIKELDQQLKDGKITESEYNRRKNRILSNKASVKEIMDRDNVSEDEALTMHVDDIIDSILSKKDVNEYILFAQPKVGKKDLSSLKRRKDIPPAIRALMGEYTDPGYNYAMSIFKIANLVENQKYLTKIRDAGLGVWLFEKEAGKKIPEGYEKITFEGDASMNPLDGLYAPKEVAEAFNDIELNRIISGTPKIGTPYKTYLKFVGGVKYSKTILSYGTHAKNVIGNMYFMAQNGYLDPREYQQPFIALVKQFSGKELTAEQEAKMDEWVRAGIIGQGATIGEIKSFFEGEDSFEKALTKRIDEKTDNMLSKAKKGVKKFGQKAQEAYQYEDDMFKIVAYEKEKLNYSKILFDGKSYNQLDASQQSTVNDYVAEIIKNILPNYGRIGGAGKFLKAFPVAGTFISFQIEAYRTAYNTVALAIQEIKGDIPGISETGKKLVQKRGVMRLISIVGFQAFKYGLISLLGIPLIPGDDDDEDGLSEKIRTLLPFWDTNSDISVREVKPNGNFTYVSISASDPYGSIFKVVNATKNSAKTGEGFSEIFGELAKPFISEDILFNTLMNIKNNENDYGGKIYKNTDTLFEKSEKIVLQLGKTFEPGGITSTRKIIQSENKLNEALGQFTGFKLHEVKSLEQAGFKFGDIQKKAQESKSAYNSIKYNMDDYETQEDINKVIRASKKAMDENYQEAVKLYQALISLGVSDRDVKKKMYDYRISAKMRSQIARNSVDVKLNPIKK
jgi:hypothetical protein